jgi:hypothetical protein
MAVLVSLVENVVGDLDGEKTTTRSNRTIEMIRVIVGTL